MTFASRTRWVVVGTAALTTVLTAALFYFSLENYVVDQRVDELGVQVTAVASGVEVAGGSSGPSESGSLAESLFRVHAGLMDAVLYVADEDGIITQSSLDDIEAIGRQLPVAELTDEDGDGTFTDERTAAGERVIVVGTRLDDGGWVVAAQPLSDVRAAFAGVGTLLLGSVVAALAVAWVAASMLSRRLARPIAHLRSAAEDVAGGDWGRQVEAAGDEELSSLAASFNRMSTRVADAYAAQKAFVGDVSHELRTPITAIRGWSEALLDGVVAEGDREQALRVINQESGRLGDLTDTLLTLADLDAGVVPVTLRPVDTASLFESLEARHARAAADAGLTIQMRDESAGTRPVADEARLLQVSTALVNNALAYTPSPGTIEIAVRVAHGRWFLDVDDSGPGVPAEKRATVFERFARLDASRSQRDGGSGLGLAIAGNLVSLMGGTLSVTDAPELGGARFTIELPLAGDADGPEQRFSAS